MLYVDLRGLLSFSHIRVRRVDIILDILSLDPWYVVFLFLYIMILMKEHPIYKIKFP